MTLEKEQIEPIDRHDTLSANRSVCEGRETDMYLFSPDYHFSRARMDERLKRAESDRRANDRRRVGRANEARGAEPPRSQRTVTVLGPAVRQVGRAAAPHLRLVK
jgi:hypothetical protein